MYKLINYSLKKGKVERGKMKSSPINNKNATHVRCSMCGSSSSSSSSRRRSCAYTHKKNEATHSNWDLQKSHHHHPHKKNEATHNHTHSQSNASRRSASGLCIRRGRRPHRIGDRSRPPRPRRNPRLRFRRRRRLHVLPFLFSVESIFKISNYWICLFIHSFIYFQMPEGLEYEIVPKWKYRQSMGPQCDAEKLSSSTRYSFTFWPFNYGNWVFLLVAFWLMIFVCLYGYVTVSQFTLYGFLKGNKPDFHVAMPPQKAKPFYASLVERFRNAYNSDAIKGMLCNLCFYSIFYKYNHFFVFSMSNSNALFSLYVCIQQTGYK